MNEDNLMRLQKFLSSAGVCSRRKGEEYIQEGRIKVNGQKVTQPGTKVNPETDRVEVDGRQVGLEKNIVYIAMNKPQGYVTTCEQPGDKIIMDLIDIPERVYPAGRLDKESTGLLLLTNDGNLHHRLLHPSFDHEKEYEVTVGRPIPEGALRKLGKGMPLMGTKTRKAAIRRVSPVQFQMVLKEGKNRQIRRMVRKVGEQVIALKRIRIANIRLGRLAEGKWRYLTEKEKKELLNNQQ
ncbi:pseudouridine synthase [Desulfobacterales bacterium HSG17]|nr:pseudouridine synthase [Desulfobacterales bacterium HSG17]